MKKILQFDIARGRVPRIETVRRITETLIPYGLDGIMFYMEAVAENSQFPCAGSGETKVSREYLQAIRDFCVEHHIEFIPHLQIFSHYERLLELTEMKQYGDEEKTHIMRLDLPELREKIIKMILEVSECFSSQYVHCGGDEAFKLGMGRSRDFFEKNGFEKVFADYVNEVNAAVRFVGKTMVMYADTPIVYPGLIEKIDKSIIMNNWAYCIRHECFESENYHYCQHKYGVAGHDFWVTANCMAEYFFTPFYRLEENVAIWRKLGGKDASVFVIADWGTHENSNPYTLSLLGGLYALQAFENPDYSEDDFVREVDKIVLKHPSPVFQEAYRTLLDASGRKYWSDDLLYYGPVLSRAMYSEPNNCFSAATCGMMKLETIDRLEKGVRRAVVQMESIPDTEAASAEMLTDLKALSKAVLAAVLRLRLMRNHAFDTGGVWFTDEQLQPQRDLYAECVDLMKEHLSFLINNWNRDSLKSCQSRMIHVCQNDIDIMTKAVRFPDNVLRLFPPRKGCCSTAKNHNFCR